MSKEKKIKQKWQFSPLNTILGVIMGIWCITFLLVLFWGVITSLKDDIYFRIDFFGLPEGHIWEWDYENYSLAFNYLRVKIRAGAGFRYVYALEMLLNTLLYGVGTAGITILTTATTAYVCCRFKYKFSNFLYGYVIVTMIIPLIGSGVSTLDVLKGMGLYDSIIGLYVTSFAFGGTNFLIFHAAFEPLSKDYADAAKIDGANNYVVLFKIMLPMVRNVIGILFLTAFIGKWNDYQTALLYLPSYPVLAQGLLEFANSTTNSLSTVPMKITACMIMTIPMAAVFIIFRNQLIGKLNIGGLKE